MAHGEITKDQAAVYKIYALFGVGSPSLPAQYISSVPVLGDGTMLFLEALKDWDQLSPSTQNFINDFITPKEITPQLTHAITECVGKTIEAPRRRRRPHRS